MPDEKTPEFWAILELMGHRRIAGYVQQVEMFGAAMLRIDIPGPDETCTLCCGRKMEGICSDGPVQCRACDGKGHKRTIAASQIYGGAAIYCLTPTTEEAARAVALRNQPQPVQRWEMLPPSQSSVGPANGHDPDDDQDCPDNEDIAF